MLEMCKKNSGAPGYLRPTSIVFERIDKRDEEGGGEARRGYATLCVGHPRTRKRASERAGPPPPPLLPFRRCLLHTRGFPLLIRPTGGSSANVSADSAASAQLVYTPRQIFRLAQVADFGLGEKHYTELRKGGRKKGKREKRESGSIDAVT